MTRKAPELPGIPPKPRKPAVKRAHMCDAGEGTPDLPYGARFACKRCGWASAWLCFDNHTDIRKGTPCPNCNTKEVEQ